MTDVKLGVTITGDGSGLRSEVKLTRDALQGLSKDGADQRAEADLGRRSSEALANTLKLQQNGVVDLDKATRDLVGALDAAAAATQTHSQANKDAGQAAGDNQAAHQNLFMEIVKGVSAVGLAKQAWETIKNTYLEVRDATLAMQESQSRLEAVLSHNASLAGTTADQLNQLAEQMARATKFDDTSLRNAMATVLSFGDVAGQNLERILKLSADMAASGRGDIEQWATVFAKVGTAPAETLGLLERYFGKLDIATKVAIISASQMGDAAKAQALAMDIVAGKVGGVAVDSYKGLEKQLAGTEKAWTHFKEALGEEIFSAKSREASVFETALDHMSATFKTRIQAMKDAFSSLGSFADVIRVLLGLPPEVAAAQQQYASSPQGLQAAIDQLDKMIASAPGSTKDLQATRAGLQSQLTALLYPSSGSESAGLNMNPQSSSPAAKPASLFTPAAQLELNTQRIQADQALGDQYYQVLQDQIARELALDEKKHAAGLISEKDYYAALADLGEQSEQAEVNRLQEAIVRQRAIVANAQAQVGLAQNQKDPDALAAASKAAQTEEAKEVALVEQRDAAEAKVGTTRKNVDAQIALADKQRAQRLTDLQRQFQDQDKALNQQTADMQLQLDAMGKTEAEAAVLNNDHKLAVQLKDEELKIERQIFDLEHSTDGKDHTDEIAALQQRLKDLPDNFAAAGAAQANLIRGTIQLRDQLKAADDAASLFANFLVSVFTQGGSALQKFLTLLKQFAGDILSIFAKQYFLQIVAGATGNAAFAAQAAQVGQGTIAGTASNFLGSAVSGALAPASSYLFGTSGAVASNSVAAGAAGETAATATYTTAGAVGEGGFMSTVGSALAAIPVWGWVALAVVAIGAWLGSKSGGGPKTGGSFMGNFDPSGAFTGDVTVPGTDNGRFFTPSDMDPAARQAGMSFASGYFAQLGAFGGTSPGASFGIGFDNDPNGTAQSRVSSSVIVGGREVYSNRDVGVDDKAVPQTIALEISRGILAGLQNSNFAGTIGDGVKAILNMVVAKTATQDQIDAVEKLATEFKSLDEQLAAIAGGPLVALQQQLAALDQHVDSSKAAFTAALATNDPAQILAAEQNLKQAVLDRYNTEMTMVMNLKHAIEDLQQQSYAFDLSIQQRIASAGGGNDVGAFALNRATQLRSGIGGNFDPASQITGLQNYVGAIDTWYQSRKTAIEADIQQQQQQIQAIAAGEQANVQARVTALQTELSIIQQWKSVLDSAQKAIDDMQLSATNPLSAEGRLSLAQDRVAAAKAAYDSATGVDKTNAANAYLASLQDELKLLPDAFQRPSPEYQTIYNDIIKQLSDVRDDAKTETQREGDLTQQLVDLQNQANGIAQWAANSADLANSQLDDLNQQYIAYLTWAQGESDRLYTLQQTDDQAQLDAVTGGQDIQLFIGEKQKEAVDLLTQIRDGILNQALGPGAGDGTGSSVNQPFNGDGSNGGGGGGGGGNGGTSPDGGAKVEVHLHIAPGVTLTPSQLAEALVPAMKLVAPQMKQIVRVN